MLSQFLTAIFPIKTLLKRKIVMLELVKTFINHVAQIGERRGSFCETNTGKEFKRKVVGGGEKEGDRKISNLRDVIYEGPLVVSHPLLWTNFYKFRILIEFLPE